MNISITQYNFITTSHESHFHLSQPEHGVMVISHYMYVISFIRRDCKQHSTHRKKNAYQNHATHVLVNVHTLVY